MTRTVRDAAILLNALVGYDPEDPLTARGVGNTAQDYTAFLDEAGLRQARIGVIREPLGYASEPDSEDFAAVDGVFDQAIEDLASAGADIVDPVSIPDIRRLLATRTVDPHSDDAFHHYFAGNSAAPFHSREEALQSPAIKRVSRFGLEMLRGYLLESSDISRLYQYRVARDALLTKLLKVMADYNLDAIVHKSVEHQPTLIRDGINPPFVRGKGALAINTFLVYVPTITVPAGFTEDCLPVGISFLGRPYSDGEMIRLAYSYEQATLHRRPPESTMAGGKTGSRALASAGCQTRRGRE
jgi:Asp-tRNA(Asn)/Glu-tRNA(Gln) amidotransferase A subunit family amidase